MIAVPASTPSRSERPLFVAAALAAALIIFAGFSRSFYLKGFFDAPPLSNLLLVHGVIMTLWIALFLTQIGLAAAGKVRVHRTLGTAGAVVALLVLVGGIAVAIDAGRRGFTPAPEVTPLAFMAIPLIDALVFAVLVSAGLWFRSRRDIHKRLMLLATLAILTPGVARLPIDAIKQGGLPAFFAVTLFCVIVVVLFDTIRNRRLHPAFGWGAALIIVSVPLRIALAQTAAWSGFAGWLIR
jgi:hypothetical protein